MVTILTNVRNAVIAGFVLALLVFVIFVAVGGSSDVTATLTGPVFWQFVFRWFRVLGNHVDHDGSRSCFRVGGARVGATLVAAHRWYPPSRRITEPLIINVDDDNSGDRVQVFIG